MKMSKEFNNVKYIFEKILGGEVLVLEEDVISKKEAFKLIVEKLQSSYEIENNIKGISISKLNKLLNPLWFVIESFFKSLYKEHTTILTWWFIFDRIDEDGNIIPIMDSEGNEILISNVDELWDLIQDTWKFDENEDI